MTKQILLDHMTAEIQTSQISQVVMWLVQEQLRFIG